MRIAVIDTDIEFKHSFFQGKKYIIKRWNPGYQIGSAEFPFSHAEYVCACIWLENPEAEIVLYNIIGNQKHKGQLLFDSLLEIMTERIVDMVNISAGVEIGFPQELYDICQNNDRIPIVSAHANNGKVSYPASFDNVIGVKKGSTEPRFFIFDKYKNDLIIDECAGLSVKQLDQEHLMRGNSLFAATITGIISKLYNTDILISELLCKMQDNMLNYKANITGNVNLKTLIISNRIKDKQQLAFCESCFEKYEIMDMNEMTCKNISENNELLFIDINDYMKFKEKKYDVINFMKKYKSYFKKFFIRYPFLSYAERQSLLISDKILVEQLYI